MSRKNGLFGGSVTRNEDVRKTERLSCELSQRIAKSAFGQPLTIQANNYRRRGAKETPIAAEVSPSNFGPDKFNKLDTPNIRRTSANPEIELLM